MAHDHSRCIYRGQHELNRYVDRKKLTQEQLADLLGVSQPNAGRYLSGERVPNRYAVVRACEEKCGVTPGRYREPVRRRARRSRRSEAPTVVPSAS